MQTIYTRNGVARLLGGAIVAGDCCDCFDEASRCACGSACSIAVTRYAYHACTQGNLGYNHSSFFVRGELGYDSCCRDCASREPGASLAFPSGATGYGQGVLWNGVDVGAGAASLRGQDFTYGGVDYVGTVGLHARGFSEPVYCERSLSDFFSGTPADPDATAADDVGSFVPGGSFIASVALPATFRASSGDEADFVPFFRTLGPGTSWVRFSRGNDACNAQNCWHSFTFRFKSAPGLRMVVTLRGGGADAAWADVRNGATSTYTYSAGLYTAGANFTLDIVVTAT